MPFQNSRVSVLWGRPVTIECGLVMVKESEAIALPLTAVSACVDIINVVAEVTLTQTYVNTSDDVIQAVYFFPVEDNAALHFFEANKDGVVLKGEIRNKGEARTEFQEAIASNKTAFLLEEHKPDVLELYVGNLTAGSTCTITLKYLTELSTDIGVHSFTLPTTIAPRYIPSSDANSIFHEANYQAIPDAPIEIILNCRMRSTIKSVSSTSHKIINTFEIKEGDGLRYTSRTILHDTVSVMDKDFVTVIVCDDLLKPTVVCGKSDEYDTYALMVSIVPDFETDDDEMCEMIFLVDCSGSMMGDKIQKAKDALIIFLQSLPTDCYFNIICFGSTFTSYKGMSVKYTDTSLKEAKMYVMQISANLGGTGILTPIQYILRTPEIEGYTKQVFVLTDGQVSNEDQVMTHIKEHRKHSRFFTLGIGEAASRSLVKGIARSGDGVSLFCTTNEIIISKVVGLLQSSLQGHFNITNVTFERKLSGDKYSAIKAQHGLSQDHPDLSQGDTDPPQDQLDVIQDQPDPSQNQPDLLEVQPDLPQGQLDTSQDQHDAIQDQPDLSQGDTDTPPDELDPIQDQPDLSQDQPDLSQGDTDTPPDELDPSQDQFDPIQDLPDLRQDQLDMSEDQPDPSQGQPDPSQKAVCDCDESTVDRHLTEGPHLPIYIFGKSRTVYFKLIPEIPDRVVLTAKSANNTVDIILDEVIALDSYIIHKLAARKIIQSLTESTTLSPSDSTLCSLALKYGVLSKYTSFISVEDNIETLEAHNLGKKSKNENESYLCTIGVDFRPNDPVGMGQERFRSISTMHMRSKQQSQLIDNVIPTIGFSNTSYRCSSSLSFGSASKSSRSSFAELVSGLFSGWSNPFKSQASPSQASPSQASHSVCVTPHEKIVKILELANIEGRFTVGTDVDLEELIGISLEKVTKECEDDSWITLVMISILEHTYLDIRDSWGMVVNKSITWAKKCLLDDYDKQKEKAEAFVKDNLKD